MWSLKRIEVENFLGFRERQSYDVPQNRATLIQGINNTDSGAESNGAGKTSFQEIVTYGYLGTSSKKDVNDKDLIHWGEDQAFLKLIFVNSRDNRKLEIERTISQTKSSTLSIKINDEDMKKNFSTVNEGNKYLISLIGVSAKDFQSYYIINDEKYQPFFNTSDKEKKEFIGRFSKAEKVLPALDRVQSKLLEKEEEISEQVKSKEKLQGKIEVYNEELKELEEWDYEKFEEELKEENKEEIEHLKNLIKKGEDELSSIEPNLEKLRNRQTIIDHQIKRLEKLSYRDQLSKIEEEEIEKNKKKTKNEQEQEKSRTQLNFYKQELSAILIELEEVLTCPKCGHNFSLSEENIDKKELENLKIELEEEIENIQKGIDGKEIVKSELKKKLDFLYKETLFINKKEKRIRSLIAKLTEEDREISEEKREYETKESNLTTSISKNKGLLSLEEEFSWKKELTKKQTENKEKQREIKNKRKLEKTKLNEIEKEIEKLSQERLDISKWVVNFKRFYTNLVNRSLMVIQGHANIFLQKMGTNLGLQLEGFKTLSNGEVREKISSNLLRNGIREGKTGSGSKGERKRLECSVIIANQTIVNNGCESGGLDLLIIDEVLDGIDGVGMQSLIDSLSGLGKTIFLTTHITPTHLPEHVLKIEKTKGVSRIVAD